MHVDFQSSVAAYWIKYCKNGEWVNIIFFKEFAGLI